MNEKHNFLLNLISSIDEEIVESNLNKRFMLWHKKTNRKRNIAIFILSFAACFLIIFTSIVLLMPDITGKQVPIYQGMTISSEAPEIPNAALEAASDKAVLERRILNLSASTDTHAVASLLSDTDGMLESEKKKPKNPIDVFEDVYYANKNEDIYIYVHISNPDRYEILSFTLNGVKYSSYMFEKGSDLETLILKCNVGSAEGIQQYTIDAIKYVDGENIKDVRMEGKKTIDILVGTNDTDVNFNEAFDGLSLVISPTWPDNFDGEKKFLSLGIYDGDTLLMELDPDETKFDGIPLGEKLLLVATYEANGKIMTKQCIINTPQSEGLTVINGTVMGIGSCSDTALYIDAPVADSAFQDNRNIQKIYFGQNVTSIGENAFNGCSSLTEISFAEGSQKIGAAAFQGCTSLAEITLPQSLSFLGASAFEGCTSLVEITLPQGLSSIGASAFERCASLAEITLPQSLSSIGAHAFQGCASLAEITLPQSLSSIGAYAFHGCASLVEITLPQNLSFLGASAFANCASIRAVHIRSSSIKLEGSLVQQVYDPETQSYIARPLGTNFMNSPELTEIYFNGTVEQWNAATSEIEAWLYDTTPKNLTVYCSDGTAVLKSYY